MTVDREALRTYLDDPEAYEALRRLQRTPPSEAVPSDREGQRVAVGRHAAPKRSVGWAWGLALAILLGGGLGGSLLFQEEHPSPPPSTELFEEAPSRLPGVDTNRPAPPDSEVVVAEDLPETMPEIPQTEQPDVDLALRQDALEPLSLADTTARQPSETVSTDLTAEPAEAMGTLSIAVQPYAEVFVAGHSEGQAPPDLSLSLAAGTHQVVLRHPQFPDYHTEVAVRPGETASLNVFLWDHVGRLSVDAQPWAEVLIDGVVRDMTPVHDLIVEPGVRNLRLRNRDLGVWDTTVVVRAGEVMQYQFNLNTKSLRQ